MCLINDGTAIMKQPQIAIRLSVMALPIISLFSSPLFLIPLSSSPYLNADSFGLTTFLRLEGLTHSPSVLSVFVGRSTISYHTDGDGSAV